MAVTGESRGYDLKFLFTIEIEGLEVSHFKSCTELKGEVGVIEDREGGHINVVEQNAGLVKFPPVTLSIGSSNNRELYDWWLQVVDASANTGEPDDEYKKNVSIVQKNRDGTEKRRWPLYKAFPSNYVAADGWDASAEETLTESVELTFLRFDRRDTA